MKSEVDLVVPFFNPPTGWSERVASCFQKLQNDQPEVTFNLILVDDGSHNTSEVQTECDKLSGQNVPFQLLAHKTNQGKGAALRTGIGASKAELTVYTDIDIPYEVESIIKVIEALHEGHDIVLGYREKDYYASVPWFRKGLSEFFRFVLQRILNFPITDTQCGLKGMGKQGRAVFMQTRVDEFMVDMEFIKRAVKARNLSIEAVSVKLRPNVVFSRMGVVVLIKEGWNFMRILCI